MSDTDPLRDVASKVIDGAMLDSFCRYAPRDVFTNPDGTINEETVMGHLTAIVAARASARPGPGDQARDALARRHGVGADTTEPSSTTRIPRGQAGRAALAARYGAKTR
jgi:hypothetical protein